MTFETGVNIESRFNMAMEVMEDLNYYFELYFESGFFF